MPDHGPSLSVLAFLQANGDERLLRPTTTDTAASQTVPAIPLLSTNPTTPNAGVVPLSHRSGSACGSLDDGRTSTSSGPSVTTSLGIRELPKIGNRALGVGGEGVLNVTAPNPNTSCQYECPFDRLGCASIFTSFDPWHEHSLTHFRSHEPPRRNACCFCAESFHERSGLRSWEMRLVHIKWHHDRGERLVTSRFDTELYRYLWSKGLISDVQYKDLAVAHSAPGSATSQPTRGDTFTDSGYASHVVDSNPFREQNSSQDDTISTYSFESVAEQERMIYQLAFSSELLKVVQFGQVDEDFLERMSSVLPDILKSFAFKLGYNAKQEKDYYAMFFISKYRK